MLMIFMLIFGKASDEELEQAGVTTGKLSKRVEWKAFFERGRAPWRKS